MELGTELLAAFRGTIERPGVSPLYRLGLALVAVGMVALPAIYVAMVGFFGYWTVTAIHGVATTASGKGKWVGPIVLALLGGTVVFFLVKPLFAPRPPRAEPRSLDRRREPVLFAVVEKLCRVVGAPMPSRIDVDTDANASASFRRGLRSIPGRDLVLTIGLPLAGGLPLRGLVGVLAHELGHFAQGTGMGLTYVVRRVNLWFQRVVYERDAWDQRLVAWSQQTGIDFRWAMLGGIARAIVWATRRVLWLLAWIGNGISCFALRQMEYDADRYEILVSGADQFEETGRQLPLLNAASSVAWNDLGAAWNDDRQLVDDLPGLVHARGQLLTDEQRAQVLKGALDEKTGFFDTHPSLTDRVSAARRLGAPGIFRDDRPATLLFADFGGLSRATTRDLYAQRLGDEARKARLLPVGHFVGARGEDEEAQEALQEIFGGGLTAACPVFPQPAEGGAAPAGAPVDEGKPARAALDAADDRLHEARVAGALARAQVKKPPPPFRGVKDAAAAQAARDEAAARLRGALAPATERIGAMAAAREASDPKVARLMEGLRAFEARWERLDALHDRYREAGALGSVLGDSEQPKLVAAIEGSIATIERSYRELRASFAEAPHPFAAEEDPASIADLAAPRLERNLSLGDIHGHVGAALEQIYGLYLRTLGHLARETLRSERAADG